MAQTRNNSRRNNRQHASPEHELVTAARVTISASPDGLSMDLAAILGDERTPFVDPSAGFSGEQTINVIEIGHQFINSPDRYPDLVFTAATAKLGLDDKGRASNTDVQDCIFGSLHQPPQLPPPQAGRTGVGVYEEVGRVDRSRQNAFAKTAEGFG